MNHEKTEHQRYGTEFRVCVCFFPFCFDGQFNYTEFKIVTVDFSAQKKRLCGNLHIANEIRIEVFCQYLKCIKNSVQLLN